MPEYDCSPDVPDCQPVRSPTVLNTAYQELMLWNGALGGVGDNLGTEGKWIPGTPLESNFLGMEGLETQAHAGQLAHRMLDIASSRVATIPKYIAMFRSAFPGDAEPVNRLNAVLANEAPFQKWLSGNKNAMTTDQKRGAILFFGKAQCVSCHTGPALSSMTFHAIGMNDLDGSYDARVNLEPFGGMIPDDVRRGRGGFTDRPEDMYKFKTPQLYNVKDSPFYGHGSSFGAVWEVVEYFNEAVPQNAMVPVGQISPLFTPLGLTGDEIYDLASFIEDALYDPRLGRYIPGRLPSGNYFPVNDPQAQIDLGHRRDWRRRDNTRPQGS